MERHLMQARAKALAEDEKNLSILVNCCPSYKTIGLPQGPSQFHKYVNEMLLAQHNLLLPSHYFPQHTVEYSFQIEGDSLHTQENRYWHGNGALMRVLHTLCPRTTNITYLAMTLLPERTLLVSEICPTGYRT